MPRRIGDPSAGDAARMARHRLLATLGTSPAAKPEEEGLLPVTGLRKGGHSAPDRRAGVDIAASGDPDPDDGWDAGPSGRPPRTRWRVPWRVPALLIVPAVLLAAWLAWQAWSGRPAAEELVPLEESTAAVTGPVEENSALSPGQGKIVVHVAGAVKKPGIVSLPPAARVFEAIAAAGGAAPGAVLDGLNLAAVVQDGSKVQVPRQGEVPAAGQTGQPGQAGPGSQAGQTPGMGGKININSASVQELDALPKVGPVLAQRIVDWRTEHGPFAAVEEIDAVDGVGPKMLEALLPLVTI